MKFFLWAAFPLLLYSFRLGKVTGEPLSPGVVKDEEGASSFPTEAQHQKSAQDLSWRSMYTPVKSCHAVLREKYGEFSPPSFPNSFEGNIWCNWTIWAGSRKHIVIYVKGFRGGESCDTSGDRIFFHGVSSLAEDTVIDACGRKEVHVFATYAQGVHVVVLFRLSAHRRREKLVGKYFLFKHRETKTSPKGAVESSEILTPELPRSVLARLSQSEKEAFLSMWDSLNTSLSASHRMDRVTELSKSLPATAGDSRVAELPSFVGQTTSAEHLIPASPSLLSASSVDNRKFSFGPETLKETRGRTSWGHLSESPTPSDVLSYTRYLSSSPLIEFSSPTEGPIYPSTSWRPFIMNDPQTGGKWTPLDYFALAMYSPGFSHSSVATTKVNNEVISSHSVEEVMSTNFQNGMAVPEGVSREAVGVETASPPSSEQNWIRTEMEGDFFLLPSRTPEQGRPGRLSASPELIFSHNHYMSKWESRTALIREENTVMLDTRPVLESGMEVADLLKTNWGITAPCGSPCGRLPPTTRSSFHETFSTTENVSPVATEFITSVDVSLNLATELLGGSQKVNCEGQRSHVLDGKMKPERPIFLDEATMAAVVSTEPDFSIFSQAHDPLLKIKPALPFPTTAEPSLPHRSKVIPDQVPTLPYVPYVGSVLSPSMALTYPFPFTEPDGTLSLPELSSLVLSETALAFSLAAERSVLIALGLEHASSETTAILQKATELEGVLSPSVTLLELTISPTAALNSLASEQTMSAFFPVNDMTSSLRQLTANAVEMGNSLSSCCPHAGSTFVEEDLPLLTIQPSRSVDPTVGVPTCSISAGHAAAELKHLFPTTQVVFTKQQLSDVKNGHSFVTAPEEDREGALFSDTVKHLSLHSETKQFPSLGRFTANGQSPQNESVAETSLIFLPVTGEEESVMNYAFISRTALASVLSYTETQSRAVFPSPLKSVDDSTRPTERPQECCKMQRSVKLQKNGVETTTSLNVPGTLVNTVPQKNSAELQTTQLPSDAETKVVSQVPSNEIELGFPWLRLYLPVKSCHVTLTDETGTFSPPTFGSFQTNNWCNWTIWAGPDKHILIYIEGFEGKPDCEQNQDKILFQGVASHTENKVAYACRNHGTLVFATQAVAAHVVFLSKASSQSLGPTHFKGRYYIFADYQMSTSAGGDADPEEHVFKSNGSTGDSSYEIHSRRILDFEKMNKIPSYENSRPVSSKGRWNKTSSASSLEVLLGPAVRHPKPTTDALDTKETQVAKPSADEYQTGHDPLAGGLKKTVVLGSNGLGDKEKAVLPSASPHEAQKFRSRTKSAAVGISTMPAGVESNGRAPVHQRPTYVIDSGRAKIERSGFLSGVTFPQVVLQEQRPPISPPKGIPEEDLDRVLQPWQSHAEIPKKSQHAEIKEAAVGERTDGHVLKEGNGDRYVETTDGAGRRRSHGTELRSLHVPEKSTVKPKSHRVVSSLNIFNSDFMGMATTSHSQVFRPDSGLVFRANENDPALESQHKPGDVLLEVTFAVEHKGGIPQHRSELEGDLIKSVTMQVQERVKFLSNKVKEIKLKEIKRKERSERNRINDPYLIFTFWLHLVPKEKNISHFIHSQLEGLRDTAAGSGKIQQVSVGDVNECSSGIEICGDEAICLNGYGTYFCQCKEEYEDRSLNKSGTLCVRAPPSGLRFLYSYMEIFVGAMIFFIAVIAVAISVLCAILKKRRRKKGLNIPEVASPNTQAAPLSQPVAFDLNNVGNLLTLDPACLKLRARSPEGSLPFASSPTEVCRISFEQSERL